MSSPSTSTGVGSRATTSRATTDASTSSAGQTSDLPSEYRTAEAIVSTARDVIRQVREGRHQLFQHNSDSDSDFISDARPAGFDSVLQTTRSQFRRRRVQDSNEQRRRDDRGRRGRAKNQLWKARLFLLRRSNPDFYPGKAECAYLSNIGLGNPHNLDPQADGKVPLQRNWSLQQFEDFVISTYPDQPLARTGFRIGCCNKCKRVTILEDIHNVLDIDKKVGRGQILIIPNRDLHAALPPTQQPQVHQPPLHEQPAHQPRLREQPARQPRLREQPARQPRLREQPARQPRLREQPARQPRLREQPARQPRLREQPADQPPLHEQPAHQPRLREQPADQPPLREQPADQPPLREQPTNQPPLHEQPADQPPLHEQPADQPPLHEQPADQPPLHEQPADQPPLQQASNSMPVEAEEYIVLSDFEFSSDESLDDHTPTEEQNAETGTPTIVIQPNRRAFSNLEALLQAEEITVVLHRSRLMEEMLDFYKNASTVNKRLKVIFDGEDGEDVGGLTREAFTSFWNAAHRVYFAGENVCLPFLPNHRMHKERENMVSLGRILSHTALLTKTFPSYIAKSAYIALVFDSEVNETCLLQDLKEYVTRPERRLISKALSDFDSMSPADVDDLTQVFMASDFHAIPSKGEIRAQLLAIADLIFVQKPAPIYRLIRQGIPEEHILTFWSQLSIDDISILLKAQKPTPRRVSAAITTGLDDLNNNQDRVLYFLRQFINSLRAEELQDFLQFCTGSIHMPLDGIKVCFNKNFGSLRRPIAHTCSNVLEISELYTTYQEFRREFHLYLSNSMSFTFSSL